MGRQMPYYCEHDVRVDGGDFADSVECPECEEGRSRVHGALLDKLDAILERLPEPVPSPFLGELRVLRGDYVGTGTSGNAWKSIFENHFEQWNGEEWKRVATIRQ